MNLKFNVKDLEVGISCGYGSVMIWSGEKAEMRFLLRGVEVSKMSIVIVIVSGFSAWLGLGP